MKIDYFGFWFTFRVSRFRVFGSLSGTFVKTVLRASAMAMSERE